MLTTNRLRRKIKTNTKISLSMDHKIIEISNLNFEILKNSESILPYLREFIAKTDLRVIKEQKHDFEPYGSTIMFLLSSSHLAVHTWPENGYLHLDLFTCSTLPNNEQLTETLSEIFETNRGDIRIKEIRYGPKNKL